MDVVGHNHPIVQQIVIPMKMPKRSGNHVGNLRPAQMARAGAAVEVTLDFSAQFPMCLFRLLRFGMGGQSVWGFGVFTLEAQQDFFWQ